MTPGETSLLSKGLNFIPTPNKEHPDKLLQDILLFVRELRLNYYFYQDTTTESTEPTEENDTHNDISHPSSGWTPPSGQDPLLESYRSTTIHNTMEIKRKNNRKFKRNLKKEEWKAITTLRNNKGIVIRPADKGGNIVIMNKQDYVRKDQNNYLTVIIMKHYIRPHTRMQ